MSKKYFARFDGYEDCWMIYKNITVCFCSIGYKFVEGFPIGTLDRWEYLEKFIKPELERLNNE